MVTNGINKTFLFVYSRVTMTTRSKYSYIYKYQGLKYAWTYTINELKEWIRWEYLLHLIFVYFLQSNHGNGTQQNKHSKVF